jgi:hypothetical protein
MIVIKLYALVFNKITIDTTIDNVGCNMISCSNIINSEVKFIFNASLIIIILLKFHYYLK